MTFISNLWQILTKAPQIIGIIKAIIDIVGSAQVQKLLESIRDALTQESGERSKESGVLPDSEPERERLVKRLILRMRRQTTDDRRQQTQADSSH